MKVAFHVHTTGSDGALTDEQVVARAAAEGAKVVAITNHDIVTAPPVTPEGVRVLASGEFSSEELSNFHIVGYNIQAPKYFNQIYEYLNNSNLMRCTQLIENIARHNGIDIDIAMVQAFAGERKVDKAIIKQYLVHNFHAASTKEAHEKLIGKMSGNYVKTLDYRAAFLVSAIKACGGTAVWAHPARTKRGGEPISIDMVDKITEYLSNFGLDGLEVTNLRSDAAHTEELEAIASKHGLVTIEGSDFHQETDTLTFDSERAEAFLEVVERNERSFSREGLEAFDREVMTPVVNAEQGTVNEEAMRTSIGSDLDAIIEQN